MAEAVHLFPLDCEQALASLQALRDQLRAMLMTQKAEGRERKPGRAIPTGAVPGGGWDWRLYQILNNWSNNAVPAGRFGQAEEEDGS